jgi:hypothetical protein
LDQEVGDRKNHRREEQAALRREVCGETFLHFERRG